MSTFTRRLLDRDGDYIELYEARISRRFEGSVRTLPEAPEWFSVSEEERGTTPEGSSYLDLSVQIGEEAPQDLFDVTFTFGDGQVRREEGFALDLRPLAELGLPEAAPGSMIYRSEERWAIQSLAQVLPEVAQFELAEEVDVARSEALAAAENAERAATDTGALYDGGEHSMRGIVAEEDGVVALAETAQAAAEEAKDAVATAQNATNVYGDTQSVQNLSFTLGDGEATLSWDAPGAPVLRYYVLEQVEGRLVEIDRTQNTSYTVTDLSDAEEYEYSVIAEVAPVVAVVPGDTRAQLDGRVLDLRPSDPRYVLDDCTDPAQTDDIVACVQPTYGPALTQSTQADAPTALEGGGLRFDGSVGQWLQGPPFGILNQDHTIIWVARNDGGGPHDVGGFWSTSDKSDRATGFCNANDARIAIRQSGSADASLRATAPYEGLHVFATRLDGGEWTGWLDAQQIDSVQDPPQVPEDYLRVGSQEAGPRHHDGPGFSLLGVVGALPDAQLSEIMQQMLAEVPA